MSKIIYLLVGLLFNGEFIFSQEWSIQYENQLQRQLNSVSTINNRVAWVAGNGGLVLKCINGIDWIDVSTSIIQNDIYCIEGISDKIAYIGCIQSPNTIQIFKTSSGGISWDTLNSYTGDGLFINVLHFFTETHGIAISDPQIGTINSFITLTTYDSGSYWYPYINAFCEPGETGYNNSANFINSTGWFGTAYGKIYKTTDSGTNWNPFNSMIYGKVQGLAFISEDVGIAFILTQNGYGYWTAMIDGIANWQVVNPPGIIWLGVPVASIPELKRFWVTGSFTEQRANKILSTLDTGKTFIEHTVEEILPTSWFNHLELAVYNDSIYGVAVTNKGQILGYHDIVVSLEDEPLITSTFRLEQNYPNPFNPSTSIRYQVPEQIFVTIKVYDILGNEIATLVNEEKPAGSYEVDWDASKLTSGIYFYSLSSGNFFSTKKMILLK
jgi:hypothetical protein